MTKQFHEQVETLRKRVLQMGKEARQSLLDGVKSLVDDDPKLAASVVARGEALNRLDVELERDALDLLALNQPMAQDLRTIGASLKIITYLDRIGRYGYDIAKVEQVLAGEGTDGKKAPRKPVAFQVMADSAVRMLDHALEAYAGRDAAKARSVKKQDDVVDGLEDEIFRQYITFMMEDPQSRPARTTSSSPATLNARPTMPARLRRRPCTWSPENAACRCRPWPRRRRGANALAPIPRETRCSSPSRARAPSVSWRSSSPSSPSSANAPGPPSASSGSGS